MEQEINVYTSLHTLISQRWKRMLLFATGLTLVVAGILFSLPRYYSATIQVIPESSEGVSLPKNIAELSSLAGFSMNANNGKDAINPDIYPDIFNSNNFIIDVLKLQVIRQAKDTMSYYNYLTFHQEQPWWDRALEVIKGNKTPQVARLTLQLLILIFIKSNSSRRQKATYVAILIRRLE